MLFKLCFVCMYRYVRENEPVSSSVLEQFGLKVGNQSTLLAAVPTVSKQYSVVHEDVMSVCHCIRDRCELRCSSSFKFVFYEAANVIYCLAPSADEVKMLCEKTFKVEQEDNAPFEFVFHNVLSVYQKEYGLDTYAHIPCRML